MKISFVGKGGSGKTTVSTLFSLYVSKKQKTVFIDADINVHVPDLLDISKDKLPISISSDESAAEIKKILIGNNHLVKNPTEFKKTTPPSEGSYIVDCSDIRSSRIAKFFYSHNDNLSVGVVGTYESDKIGISCYHNNLSVLENILSHSIASNSYLVVDMVAGTDAFASTMHSQFDISVVVVEPTQKSINVYSKYVELAKQAGTVEEVFYVANKVEDEYDLEFIYEALGSEKCLGSLSRSAHLRKVDKKAEKIDPDRLEPEEISTLKNIKEKLDSCYSPEQSRLDNLWGLHRKYVGQEYVTARHGDLRGQIDEEFTYPG